MALSLRPIEPADVPAAGRIYHEAFRAIAAQLDNGLRMVQPMTLMSVGLYNEPRGAYLPSILF